MDNSDNKNLLLSIIVPIYNVEEYLKPCLESISNAIKNINAEVLLIDDGSTDGSSDIAVRYVENHTGFRYYRKDNGGQAEARNLGVKLATGKYIAFVDSDDLITEDMYEKLLASAEVNNTDIALVNVARFNSRRVSDASLFIKVFSDLGETVTHIKDADSLIYDTITCNKIILRSFWENNRIEFPVGWKYEDVPVAFALHCKAKKVSVIPTVGYLWRVREGQTKSTTQNKASLTNLQDRIEMLDRMYEFIDKEMEGDERLKELLSKKILSFDLIIYIDEIAFLSPEAQGQFRSIIIDFFHRHLNNDYLQTLPAMHKQKYIDLFEERYDELLLLKRFGKKAYYSSPICDRDGKYLKITREYFDEDYYDAINEYSLSVPTHSISDVVVRKDKIIIQMYSYFHRCSIGYGEQSIEASLVNTITGNTKSVPVSLIEGEDVTFRFGKVYDDITGELYSYNYDGSAFQIEIDPGQIGSDNSAYNEYCLQVRYVNAIKDGSYYVKIKDKKVRDRIDGLQLTDGDKCVTIKFDAQGDFLVDTDKTAVIRSDKSYKTSSEKIVSNSAEVVKIIHSNGEVFLDLCLNDGLPALLSGGTVELAYYDKRRGEGVTLCANKVNHFEDGTHLSFNVDFGSHDLNKNLYDMESKVYLTLSRADAVFPVLIDADSQVKFGTDNLNISLLPDCSGELNMLVRKRDYYTENTIDYNRKKSYPKFRKEPINENLILFEAYEGRQYSCNPRALYEYIDANHSEYQCVWSLADERTPICGAGIRVRRHSEEYYHYLATAKYYVTNTVPEKTYRKRKEQIVIQTMHGTSVKSIVPEAIEDNQRWDYAIAQGVFAEKNMDELYGFSSAALRTGYPRTDVIFNASDKEKQTIKHNLGIPEGKKVILYSPSSLQRDDQESLINLSQLENELNKDYVLLIKPYCDNEANCSVFDCGDFIYNEIEYSRIEDLYNISDIMVTDCASALFDYSLTKKPMIVYRPEKEKPSAADISKCDIDIISEAPALVVETTGDLVRSITMPDHLPSDRKTNSFAEKYLTYERNNSAERVFSEVFADSTYKRYKKHLMNKIHRRQK